MPRALQERRSQQLDPLRLARTVPSPCKRCSPSPRGISLASTRF